MAVVPSADVRLTFVTVLVPGSASQFIACAGVRLSFKRSERGAERNPAPRLKGQDRLSGYGLRTFRVADLPVPPKVAVIVTGF